MFYSKCIVVRAASFLVVIIWWSSNIALTRVTNAQRGRLAAGYKYPWSGHHTWPGLTRRSPVSLVLTRGPPLRELRPELERGGTYPYPVTQITSQDPESGMTLFWCCNIGLFLHINMNNMRRQLIIAIECTQHIMLKHSLPPLVTWSDNVKH